ncbi:calcineurin-like phosphoesterase family protein [Pseudonocardia sediminis]|uniref:Calcineurin-like phosphoesterase family protein n=1 Tax=Pseudonocardia sediminis TaxID=1397368 RepID=A0A4Q7UUC3_PSEST|nr:metallophosphoesterase [Pseudonocardia sediminis]RZT85462.1 calcineurin-like phosphoesterase family protein [Pseudonocardia sediminis]
MSVNPRGETPDVGVPAALARDMTVAEQHEWITGFLRRHRVSRRTALRGGAGALAALGMAGAPWAQQSRALAAEAPVAVIGRHLSFGADPTTAMAIAGELTAKPGARPIGVDLGTDTGYGRSLPVEIRPLQSLVPQGDGSIRGAEQWFVHADATGLRPGHRYHYRFRMPDGSVTPDASFRTAPVRGDREPFTFTAFADQGVSIDPPDGQKGFKDKYKPTDTRRTPAPSDAMVARIASDEPAFHLLAGDICYADPTGNGKQIKNFAPEEAPEEFNNFDPTVWTAYFGAIERSAASTPWMFATGNHDMEALYDGNTAPGGANHGYGGHLARLDLPGNGPSSCPSVYSFTHGTVGVVSVDANDLSEEIPTNAGYSGGAQLRWLETTLAGFRKDPGVDFVVAFFHHCAFATSGSHASDAGVRKALAPLFDKYRVDLAVQGHNHQYERTNPIRGGRSTVQAADRSTVRPAHDGTTYICVGSGGRPSYTWQKGETDRFRGHTGPDSGTEVTSFLAGRDDAKTLEKVDWSQSRYLGYAYLRCEVVPGRPGGVSYLRVRAITDAGHEIDRVELARDVPRHGAAATSSGWTTHPPTGLSVPGTVPA